jgi:hypothetical protein
MAGATKPMAKHCGFEVASPFLGIRNGEIRFGQQVIATDFGGKFIFIGLRRS